jgi:predicted transcriptional regulator
LEQEVVAVLGAAGEPLTPGQVQKALDAGLAYTTVMTVLSRLGEKGVVTRARAGRAFAYMLVQDGAERTARQMQRLLAGGDDRAAVLSRFVDVLSDEDEQVLTELLSGSEQGEQP